MNQLNQKDPIHDLCMMVLNTQFEDLPQNVINYAKDTILDTMSVTMGGSSMEGIPAIVDFIKGKGGKPESIIPFYGGKVPASEAGLAIGPMSRAMDYGSTHKQANHCAEYVFPTLLAATGLKGKVTGKEFITSFIVGCDVSLRIGIAYNRGLSAAIGGHYIFGCVSAVGKLIGLTLEELLNAQGIACEMTQPHNFSMFVPSTLMIRVHHGFICQDAINACLLAKRGITGPRQGVLNPPNGYLGFATWETKPGALTDNLSKQWEILNLTQKYYPSVLFSQNPVDGIIDQMNRYRFTGADIANINIETSGGPTSAQGKRIKPPQSEQECQFNLPFLVATAAYDGDISLDSYREQARTRSDILDLMNRISIKNDPNLRELAIRMHTSMQNGKEFSDEYTYPKGDPKNPLTAEDLINKFKKCSRSSAYLISEKAIDSIIMNLQQLEMIEDINEAIIVPLTPE